MLNSKLTTKLKHRVLAWQKSHLGGFATLKQRRHKVSAEPYFRFAYDAIYHPLNAVLLFNASCFTCSAFLIQVKTMKINQMTFQHCFKWVFLPTIHQMSILCQKQENRWPQTLKRCLKTFYPWFQHKILLTISCSMDLDIQTIR